MRRSTSISTPRSLSVLSRITSSIAPSGSALWPVRCGATWSPCSRANMTISLTSQSLSGTATNVGVWTKEVLNARVAGSQPGLPGSITAPRTRFCRLWTARSVSTAVIDESPGQVFATATVETIAERRVADSPDSPPPVVRSAALDCARAQALVPPDDGQPGDRGGVHRAAPAVPRLARVPRGGARGRRAGRQVAAPARGRRDDDPVCHPRPGRVHGPRPGVPQRAPRRRLPRALRDRRRRRVRRPGRPDGRRGPPAGGDALRARRERSGLPAGALRGRRQPAPRPDPSGARVDDGHRRDGRGDRRARRARARPQPREARLRERAAGTRRGYGRQTAPAPARGRDAPAAARGPPRRRQPAVARAGDHPGRTRLRAPVPGATAR